MEDKICPLMSIASRNGTSWCRGPECAFFFDVRENYELPTNTSAKKYNRCALVGIIQRLDEIQEAVERIE